MYNISRRTFLKTSAIVSLGFSLGFRLQNSFTLLIKNGTIVDGLGNPAFKGDIGLVGNQIKAIGNLQNATADIVIDASNLIVSPGFIDIHTHTDERLLICPEGTSKIYQGVTTEVGGNCGFSPFPQDKDAKAELYGNLKDEKEEDTFTDLDGMLNNMHKNGISINFATFTGHGNLRAAVIGRNDVQATVEQMKKMEALLQHTFDQGSFGLTTGLEYPPGSYANTEELINLAKIVQANDALYSTHMRNEDDTVIEAIEETYKITRESGVNTEISHIKACNPANWHKVDRILEMLDEAKKEGLPVNADRYPYTAYGTGLSQFVPLWARQGSTDEVLERMKDPELKEKIKAHVESRGDRIGGWDRVMLSRCSKDENKQFIGKTVKEACEITGMDPYDFVKNILVEERMDVGMVGFAMDEANLRKVLTHDSVMIGSDGSVAAPEGKLSSGMPHPRYYGTFPRVLGKYARDEKFFDLPTAVKKMTSMPAEKMALKQRGCLKEGYFADITLFDPNKVIDKATFSDPHQLAEGISYVIVNGVPVIENGKHNGKRPGEALRFKA